MLKWIVLRLGPVLELFASVIDIDTLQIQLITNFSVSTSGIPAINFRSVLTFFSFLELLKSVEFAVGFSHLFSLWVIIIFTSGNIFIKITSVGMGAAKSNETWKD